MNGRGGDAPPPDGGEFLLQLLRRPLPNSSASFLSQPHPGSQNFSQDPAVAAVGPSIPTFPSFRPTNSGDLPFTSWIHHPSPLFGPQNFFQQNPNPNPNLNPNSFSSVPGMNYNPAQVDFQSKSTLFGDDARKLGFYSNNSKPSGGSPGHNLIFGSLNHDALKNGANVLDRNENNFASNSSEVKENFVGNPTFRVHKQERSSNSNDRMKQGDGGSHRAVAPPPGFLSNSKSVRHVEHGFGFERNTSDLNGDKSKSSSGPISKNDRLSNELDIHGFPAGSSLHSASTDIEKSMKDLHVDHKGNNDVTEVDDLDNQGLDAVGIEDESSVKSDKKKYQVVLDS